MFCMLKLREKEVLFLTMAEVWNDSVWRPLMVWLVVPSPPSVNWKLLTPETPGVEATMSWMVPGRVAVRVPPPEAQV